MNDIIGLTKAFLKDKLKQFDNNRESTSKKQDLLKCHPLQATTCQKANRHKQ